MSKEEFISMLEMFISVLKKQGDGVKQESVKEDLTVEPIVEQLPQPTVENIPQPIVEQLSPQPLQQLPQIQQQPQPQIQLPATGWDILRHNQQKITALEEELNRMKMASSTGIPISQYPNSYMTPVTPVQPLQMNTHNIGGSL